MEIVAERFDDSVKKICGQVQTWEKANIWDKEYIKSFFTFCDINYVHGY